MIRIAVIGAGHWGPNLIRNFHNKRTSEVGWVIDTSPSRLEEVRSRFPDVRVSASVDDALGDPTVDAVSISTPKLPLQRSSAHGWPASVSRFPGH